jgi:hypothetical protein
MSEVPITVSDAEFRIRFKQPLLSGAMSKLGKCLHVSSCDTENAPGLIVKLYIFLSDVHSPVFVMTAG